LIDNPPEPTETKILGAAAHLCITQPILFSNTFIIAEPCCARKKDREPCENPGKFIIGGQWYCGVHVDKRRHDAVRESIESESEKAGAVLSHSREGANIWKRKGGSLVCIASSAPSRIFARWMALNQCELVRIDLPPYGKDEQRIILSPEQMDICMMMRESVVNHPAASALLKAPGPVEASVVFTSDDQLCKARPDKYCEIGSARTIPDLKTTQDASREAFEDSVFRYGYYRQSGFYREAMHGAGYSSDSSMYIAVENKEPFSTAVYRLHEDDVLSGWKELQPLVRYYRQCEESGNWPGYSEGIQDISLSQWRRRKIHAKLERV
jgi:hypothetical protein